jgi:ATP-dependent Lon protease
LIELDRKVNDIFAGKVVRKDLVRKVKVGANVPVHVLEYLIGKYCATDDPAAIEVGLRMVNRTIADNFIRPDEANKAQYSLKDRGKATFIDKVRVRVLEEKDWAEMANFGNRYLHVPDQLIRKYPRILELGVWAQVDLEYRVVEDEEHGGNGHPFYITNIRPIQLASFDFEQYIEGRREFTTRSISAIGNRKLKRKWNTPPSPTTKMAVSTPTTTMIAPKSIASGLRSKGPQLRPLMGITSLHYAAGPWHRPQGQRRAL